MIASTELITVKKQVAQLLGKTLSGVDVTEGFSPQQYFLSLRRPMVCVAIQKVLARKEYLQNFIGIESGDSCFSDLSGYFCDVILDIPVYLPKGYQEKDGNDLFVSVCSSLLFNRDYEFEEISCGEMVFDEKIQAFVIPVSAKTSFLFTQKEEFAILSSIQMKQKEEII